MDYADEIFNMKENVFEACSTMDFMRGSDKIKYRELIYYFSIQYMIKNDQRPKILQGEVYIICIVKFKLEKNNDQSNTKKENKDGGGDRDK